MYVSECSSNLVGVFVVCGVVLLGIFFILDDVLMIGSMFLVCWDVLYVVGVIDLKYVVVVC